MFRTAICTALALLGLGLCADEGYAQGNASRKIQNSLYNRPTVSPYLNLLQPQGGGLPNYQTLVRPAIDQRRRNQDTNRQIAELQGVVAANNVRDQRGETQFRPTGHATGNFYYSHFFPLMSQRRR